MSVAVLLSLGSKGDDVAFVQGRLVDQGFDPGPIDGDFGPVTDAAVRSFQQARGLDVDGVVGPQTLAALGELGAGQPGPETQPVSTLVELGLTAEQEFGLTVSECSAPGAPTRWAPVHSGHAATSLHFQGRAFDTSGPAEAMEAFAARAAEAVASLAELIHNPNASVKNGQAVDPSFWGDATWSAHVDHVHVAV
jgi:hypothetical protein